MSTSDKDKKAEILARLHLEGISIDDDSIISSFREVYKDDIDSKIATEMQRYDADRKLMEAAPKLLQIAEMFHDHMLGNEMQRTMVFNIVKQVLHHTK